MDLRMPRSVLEDARKEEMQNKREQDAYLKVSGNILKNIQDRMFALNPFSAAISVVSSIGKP